jgi:aspartate racemase
METSRGALGVLGGMGPLATAEFIRTIYETNLAPVEQSMPRVITDCDPGLLPDRTQAISDRDDARLARRLEERLRRLSAAGATRTVLACVTAHHFLGRVSPGPRDQVISLITVMVQALAQAPDPVVLLATRGTLQARIFQREPGWLEVASRVVVPAPADQDLIHRLVYRAKQLQAGADEVTALTDRLCERYGCAGVALGCTEFHLYGRALTARYGPARVVDPLRHVAAGLPRYLDTSPVRESPRC